MAINIAWIVVNQEVTLIVPCILGNFGFLHTAIHPLLVIMIRAFMSEAVVEECLTDGLEVGRVVAVGEDVAEVGAEEID